jgi:hypothetical protein
MTLPYRKVAEDFLKSGKSLTLAQAYGNCSMPEFAIVAPDGTMIGAWMRCKDYIQDVWWGFFNQKKYSIYGWEWNPESDPHPSTRWLLLAIRWAGKSQDEMQTMLENVKGTMEDVEKKLRIPRHLKSKFSTVRSDYFIVYGSPRWLKAVCTVSFFTWLIRASLTNTGKKYSTLDRKKFAVTNDSYYANSGADTIKLLMEFGFKAIEADWQKYTEVRMVHNNGIQGQNANAKAALQKMGITVAQNSWD